MRAHDVATGNVGEAGRRPPHDGRLPTKTYYYYSLAYPRRPRLRGGGVRSDELRRDDH